MFETCSMYGKYKIHSFESSSYSERIKCYIIQADYELKQILISIKKLVYRNRMNAEFQLKYT